MAIPALAPLSGNSKQSISSKKTVRPFLRSVPEFKNGESVDRKSFVIFLSLVSGLGLIALLTINTLLAQDAFELRKLQTDVTTLNDQRDALIKQIATASSPEVLARRAEGAGMVQSQSPRFLALPPVATTQVSESPTSRSAR